MVPAQRRIGLVVLVAAGLMLSANGCGTSTSQSSSAQDEARTTVVAGAKVEPEIPPAPRQVPKELAVQTLRPGWGATAQPGDLLTTRFTSEYTETGKRFESSWEDGQRPFSFHLGAEESSPGWEMGLRGFQVGERRELIIPPDLGSRFGTLPADSTLTYVVELIGVTPPELDDRSEPDVAVPPGPPPQELVVRDLIDGRGPAVRSGDLVTMNYVSKRYDGRPFSNSWDDGHPFRIHLGAGTFKSIPGWEKGLPGMRIGGRREIIVPPDLIFQGGARPDSKPSDTLVYLVDMLGVTEPGAFHRAPRSP